MLRRHSYQRQAEGHQAARRYQMTSPECVLLELKSRARADDGILKKREEGTQYIVCLLQLPRVNTERAGWLSHE